jgi:ABC-type phosphate transport system substrate-binding protein
MMKKIFIFVTLALLTLLCFAQDYQIVVNQSNSASTISKMDIKNIFLGKKTTWDNGEKIIPVMLASGNSRKMFLKTAVKKSNTQFVTFWKKAVFTGTGVPPKEFNTEAEMLDFIAKNPNAIGFTSSGQSKASVKVITIQ